MLYITVHIAVFVVFLIYSQIPNYSSSPVSLTNYSYRDCSFPFTLLCALNGCFCHSAGSYTQEATYGMMGMRFAYDTTLPIVSYETSDTQIRAKTGFCCDAKLKVLDNTASVLTNGAARCDAPIFRCSWREAVIFTDI
jgi:hypothetical protein